MGSWIITNMPAGQLPDRRRAFESTFSVAGVPPLYTEVHSLGGDWHALLWAWSAPPVQDVTFVSNGAGDRGLVLCGALTGLGRFGAVPPAPRECAAQVLDLYERHGGELLPELNGSFSLAVIDTRRQSLTLHADRFASRPVWFAGQRTPAAGNFPAAIAALAEKAPSLDPAGLWALFATGRHVGRRGLYSGIHNLQAGEQVTLGEADEPAVGAWYRLRYRPENGPSVREWGAAVAQHLTASAARLAAVTPRPYLFLSGGLDSRLAAGALGPRTQTATLTSSANMNARVARKVASAVGAAHHTLTRGPHWYLETFEAASLAASGNYNIKHAHFMGGVRQIKAADPSASFLLGDLLENFNKHYFKKLPDGDGRFSPDRVPEQLPQLYSYGHPDPSRLRRLFRPEVADRIHSSWRHEMVRLCEDVSQVSGDARDCYDALFRWYNSSLCPTYMMLECIVPLAGLRNLMWDNDLYDLYSRVPADVRGSQRTHPWALWYTNPRLALMPDANAWQPPLAPQALKRMARRVRPFIGRTRRRLMTLRDRRPATRTEGSWQMMQVFFRTDPKYREFIEACLFSEACFPAEIFDRAAIEHTWRAFLQADTADTYEIDVLLSFGLLHRRLPASGLAL